MTAARRPRSAALLVGSTSGTSANVQSAGHSFKRFFASARTCRCRLPVEPQRLLRAETEIGVEGKVAAQVRPAHLPPLRLEAVVGAETVGADDAGERIADQSVQVLLTAIGRDSQHRRLLAERTPQRARLAA